MGQPGGGCQTAGPSFPSPRLAGTPWPKNDKKAVPESWPGCGEWYAGGIRDDSCCCVGYSARVEEGGQVAAYSLQ